METDDKIIELLQEIRDNQKLQIESTKRMKSLYIKIVIFTFILLGIMLAPYYLQR